MENKLRIVPFVLTFAAFVSIAVTALCKVGLIAKSSDVMFLSQLWLPLLFLSLSLVILSGMEEYKKDFVIGKLNKKYKSSKFKIFFILVLLFGFVVYFA